MKHPLAPFSAILAASLIVGCGPSTSSLESGYAAAALDLQKRAVAALNDDSTQATILDELHEAEKMATTLWV